MPTTETTGPTLEWKTFHEEDSTRATAEFSQRELAFLRTAVEHINFWNRIAAPFGFASPTPQAVA